MTEEQITGLGPALRVHLRSYRGFLGRGPILKHIDTYCRGLLSGGGKGDRNLLCAAPFGPFRQKVPVPFSGPQDLPMLQRPAEVPVIAAAVRGQGSAEPGRSRQDVRRQRLEDLPRASQDL